MTKHVQTTSDDGFVSTTDLTQGSIRIDATGEETADTLDHLLGVYAACYIPAFRVAAEQRDVGDLGQIDIDVTGELNESDKLESIAFDMQVDAEVGADDVERIVERASQLCKVHDALKDSLAAQITINGHQA